MTFDTPSSALRFIIMPFFALALWIMPATAELPLSGEQDGLFETGNYIVTGTVVVKRGKTLSFSPGCIVRFKRYAGIVVEGTLKCIGTEGLPIMFTSDNHRTSGLPTAGNLTPFDWTGIVVVDSLASLDFEFTHVLYATFGLDVKSSLSMVRLKNAYFDQNGQFNARVNGKQLEVKDNEPVFYFQGKAPEPEKTASSVMPEAKPAEAATASPQEIKRHDGFQGDWQEKPIVKSSSPKRMPKTWRFPVRIGLASLAVAGGAIGLYYNSEVAKFQEKVTNGSSRSETDNAVKWRNRAKSRRDAAYIVGMIGSCGFGLTFLF